MGGVALKCLDHVLDREAEACEPGGHRCDDILLAVAAHRIDFGDAWYCAQLRPYHPAMEGPQILRRMACTVLFDCARPDFERVHRDFAHTGCTRAAFGSDGLGSP